MTSKLLLISMGEEKDIEVYRQHRDHQNRYTYFLLAVSASAIALSLNNTEGSSLSYYQIPLGLAVLSWEISFFFGCRQLSYISSTLFANMTLLRVQRGEHKDVGTNIEMIRAATEGIREGLKINSDRASFFARYQFRLLVLGAIFYLTWHIIEMWLIT